MELGTWKREKEKLKINNGGEQAKMLQKISIRSLATTALIMLILVTILYYIAESFFPGHVSSFMLFCQFVGGLFFVLMTVALIALSISAFRLVIRHIKGN